MKTEDKILDDINIVSQKESITTSKLALKGALIIMIIGFSIPFGAKMLITLLDNPYFFEPEILIIVPIVLYIYLLIKYRKFILTKNLKRAAIINGVWLASLSIPLTTIIVLSGGGRFFHPNIIQSLFIALLFCLPIFLIGTLIGSIQFFIKNKKFNWKYLLYFLFLTIAFSLIFLS